MRRAASWGVDVIYGIFEERMGFKGGSRAYLRCEKKFFSGEGQGRHLGCSLSWYVHEGRRTTGEMLTQIRKMVGISHEIWSGWWSTLLPARSLRGLPVLHIYGGIP